MPIHVDFRTRELQSNFESLKNGVRAWGDVVAKNYIRRIRALQAVARMEDLEKLPQLNFHALKGNRKGQYAVNLTGRARLILTRGAAANSLIVYEVDLNHYGD